MKELLERYAEIKLTIKRLEAEADELNPQILEFMKDKDVTEVDISDIGKLSIGNRRKWKYTSRVTEMDKALKDQKAYEEQVGEATYEENPYLLFKSI